MPIAIRSTVLLPCAAVLTGLSGCAVVPRKARGSLHHLQPKRAGVRLQQVLKPSAARRWRFKLTVPGVGLVWLPRSPSPTVAQAVSHCQVHVFLVTRRSTQCRCCALPCGQRPHWNCHCLFLPVHRYALIVYALLGHSFLKACLTVLTMLSISLPSKDPATIGGSPTPAS